MMDDYIPRKSVYDALCKICNDSGACERNGSEGCHKVFADIPAADVRENVYADCIKLNNDPYIMWKCGNCGWIRERTSKPKFCEECGAEFLPAVRGEKDE